MKQNVRVRLEDKERYRDWRGYPYNPGTGTVLCDYGNTALVLFDRAIPGKVKNELHYPGLPRRYLRHTNRIDELSWDVLVEVVKEERLLR